MTISFNPRTNLYKIGVSLGSLQLDFLLDPGFFNPQHDWSGFNHSHGAYELQFVLSGSCKLFVDAAYIELEADSYCIIPPHTYHSQITDDMQTVQKICFMFDYRWKPSPTSAEEEAEAAVLKSALDRLAFRCCPAGSRMLPLLQALKSELERKDIGYIAQIQTICLQILIRLLRDGAPSRPAGYTVPSSIVDDERMSIIDAFFGNNYALPVKEQDLASLLMVGGRQLNRILHDLYRTSFRQKLLETRMKVAMDMLVHNECSVKEVAESVGYLSVENFHAAFKKETGTTPALFRKQFRQHASAPGNSR